MIKTRTLFTCNKCKKELERSPKINVIKTYVDEEEYALCPECFKKFKHFMSNNDSEKDLYTEGYKAGYTKGYCVGAEFICESLKPIISDSEQARNSKDFHEELKYMAEFTMEIDKSNKEEI